jgi:hypothetical protein
VRRRARLPRRDPRVRKIDERKPIDAVPAMALAVWRATQTETSDIPLAALKTSNATALPS